MIDSFFLYCRIQKNNMIIRPAQPNDAPQLAKLINMAMLDITYQFIGKEDQEEADLFIESLVREKNNQYSYQHIFVIQELDNIIGHICIYDGTDFERLRQNVWKAINNRYKHHYFADAETRPGEMYIDTFAICPSARGKGLGKELLQFAINHFVNKQHKILGLLVDKDNPNAKKLYVSMGFKVMDERDIFGKKMEHMQYA